MNTSIRSRKILIRSAVGIAAVLLSAVLAACGSANGSSSGGTATDPSSSPTEATSSSQPAELPQSDEPATLDPATVGPEVTNPWLPLEPGTRWIYRELGEKGEVLRVVMTVSTETRMIGNGVEARVVRDTVSHDGEVLEDTLDWYAQDADGTVWYLGEDTAEFKDGAITGRNGPFEAGVDGALAGVIMPAEPTVGQAYRQEYYEGIAEESGEVLALDGTATVPAGSFDGLVQTEDTNGLEPDVLEHKFYAEGVGLVLAVDLESGDRAELLAVRTVSPAEAERAGTAPLGSAY